MNDSFIGGSVLSTGIPAVDLIMGGGLPVGAMTGASGANHAGKRTLIYSALAEQQRRGEQCILMQVGRKVDACYASAIGVKLDGLDRIEISADEVPDGIELATAALEKIAEVLEARKAAGKASGLLVLDWVPSPKLGHAPIPTDVVTRALEAIESSGVACLYTVHVPRPLSRGPLHALYARGLRPLEWRTPVRFRLTKCAHSHLGCGTTEHHVHVHVVENKLAEPHMEAVLDIDTAGGVVGGRLLPESLVQIGVNWGIFSYRGPRCLVFRGEELGATVDAVTRVSRDADLADTIQSELEYRLALTRGDRK